VSTHLQFLVASLLEKIGQLIQSHHKIDICTKPTQTPERSKQVIMASHDDKNILEKAVDKTKAGLESAKEAVTGKHGHGHHGEHDIHTEHTHSHTDAQGHHTVVHEEHTKVHHDAHHMGGHGGHGVHGDTMGDKVSNAAHNTANAVSDAAHNTKQAVQNTADDAKHEMRKHT
jgi:hypothetical protein